MRQSIERHCTAVVCIAESLCEQRENLDRSCWSRLPQLFQLLRAHHQVRPLRRRAPRLFRAPLVSAAPLAQYRASLRLRQRLLCCSLQRCHLLRLLLDVLISPLLTLLLLLHVRDAAVLCRQANGAGLVKHEVQAEVADEARAQQQVVVVAQGARRDGEIPAGHEILRQQRVWVLPRQRQLHPPHALRQRRLAPERLHRHAEPPVLDRGAQTLGQRRGNELALRARVQHGAKLHSLQTAVRPRVAAQQHQPPIRRHLAHGTDAPAHSRQRLRLLRPPAAASAAALVFRPAAAAVTAVVALQWGCQLTCAHLGSACRPHRAHSFFGRGAPSSPLPPRRTCGHAATKCPCSWHARHDRSSFLDVHSRTPWSGEPHLKQRR